MPKYKVMKSFMYTGTTTISAPNLELAERMAKDISKQDFKSNLDKWKGDAWVNSITQQENDDE